MLHLTPLISHQLLQPETQNNTGYIPFAYQDNQEGDSYSDNTIPILVLSFLL